MPVEDKGLVRSIFAEEEAIVTNDHFVYAAGDHGPVYVNKDRIYVNAQAVGTLCMQQVTACINDGIVYDTVVGPEKGGIILAQWIGFYSRQGDRKINSVYAERKERVLFKPKGGLGRLYAFVLSRLSEDPDVVREVIQANEELIVRSMEFTFKRDYDQFVRGKRVLIAEDILNSGGSVQRVIDLVRETEGEVVGVVGLYNRGGVSAGTLGVPYLSCLIEDKLEKYAATPESPCPLCVAGIPVNEKLGKGKAYMDAKRAAAANN
jgi:orotate phosphoribosyltransferase